MKTIKEQSTQVFKSYHGWTAETITTANGQTFKITTMKRHSGFIVSDAQPGQAAADDQFRSFTVTDMFNGNITLLKEKGRATEKAIRDQHNKALISFDEKVNNGEIQPEKPQHPEIGTILFTDGYGKTKGSPENHKIVYKIEEGRFGKIFHTVERDTLKLEQHTGTIKPFSKKFGIGTYFEPDFKFTGSQDELNNLVIDAKQKAKKKREQEQAEKELKEQIRQAKIEEGRDLVTIPKTAKAVIVADLYENRSDAMTDYFATAVVKTVYLAFSSSQRNNMNELREAAKNWEETEKLLTEEDTGEHREQHSYLPDYFIGSDRWYGWKVNKRKYFDLSNEKNREEIYIAAAEGRYFIPEEKGEEPTPPGDVWIEKYSEKAGVVRGDTKPIKEQLKKLDCRFNPRLQGGPGWIFPLSRKQEIEEGLDL